MFEKRIKELATALIIGKGEVITNQQTPYILSDIAREKVYYLKDFIRSSNQEKHFEIEKESVTVHHPEISSWALNTFYRNGVKIFSSRLDTSRLSLNSIVLWIILYGKRNEDYIDVSTTINSNYFRVLMYCLEHHLEVPILSGYNQIKILNVKQVYQKVVSQLSVNHSAEFANFLSRKEYSELVKQPSLNK